ncbi:four helix bundle protein [Flavobacterium rhamnosiphilum]|uniref:Four helix bundle protein n=1 Tax=Flavobacterium rhamnosiphilum TaxID=2541724 RepID=A0A4R5F3M2_9FLAO|nr:four helix bundle protein [Flavobacterium rhamnosiphilum]TDE41817.1 four helix bundle protein [Flavobacterium rhamnosiphilum]
MKENIIKSKSFDFAIRIVKLYQYLCFDKKEFILSKQLLRSGTSIGAMIREAEHAESRQDFVHKLSIAQKEANEVVYWLELLKATDYLNEKEFENINNDAISILKLITSIIKTTKAKVDIKK